MEWNTSKIDSTTATLPKARASSSPCVSDLTICSLPFPELISGVADTVGGMVGPLFGGPVADRFGRRGGMFVGSLLIILGSAVIASAPSQRQFVGGRFILGFGVSFLTVSPLRLSYFKVHLFMAYSKQSAAPSYCRMTGFYNCGWFGGSIRE